jgi:hypothetical protein
MNFRFQLQPKYQEGSTKTLVVSARTQRTAINKLKKWFNDVKQFQQVR